MDFTGEICRISKDQLPGMVSPVLDCFLLDNLSSTCIGHKITLSACYSAVQDRFYVIVTHVHECGSFPNLI